ncbi:MAG: hypothetical protein GX053_05830 [Tissierella sp.]|nr:hypothetical protein [Tissierella sp.]
MILVFFQSKLDRAMEWIKNRNEISNSPSNEIGNINEEDFKFDKTDILALIISALLVFGPVIIVLLTIVYFLLQIS